jgi:hypothetical protein
VQLPEADVFFLCCRAHFYGHIEQAEADRALPYRLHACSSFTVAGLVYPANEKYADCVSPLRGFSAAICYGYGFQ